MYRLAPSESLLCNISTNVFPISVLQAARHSSENPSAQASVFIHFSRIEEDLVYDCGIVCVCICEGQTAAWERSAMERQP